MLTRKATRKQAATRLPDFIVIGAQKSGTSSIYCGLSSHPEIDMAVDSEVEFFSDARKLARGANYYKRHFPVTDAARQLGEVSPGYMYNPLVAKRMSRMLPDVKLIASLRDPVDRAFSAWKMQVAKGSERQSFSDAIRSEPNYISIGKYGEQLSRYLRFFSRSQLLIVHFAELRRQPLQFWARLTDFLDIVPIEEERPIVNKGGMPRHMYIAEALNLCYRFRNVMRNSPLEWLVDNLVVDRAARSIRNKIATFNSDPSIVVSGPTNEDIRLIQSELTDDIAVLRRHLGKQAPAWARR